MVRHQPRAVVGRIDLDFYSRLGELGRVVEDGQAEYGRQLDARLSHRAQTRRLHSRVGTNSHRPPRATDSVTYDTIRYEMLF